MLPLLGGLASGAEGDEGALLLDGEDVLDEGAVGVRFDGVEMLPCVSQGASPIGPELTITAAEGNVIDELAGRPALEKLRETIEELAAEDLELVAGRAADGHRRRRQQARLRAGRLPRARAGRRRPGDRQGRRGAPPCGPGRSSACTPATPPAPTATCARRSACAARRSAARAPAGALVFACNGRGRGMFGSARPRRRGGRRGARRRPGGAASSPRARSARSAASTSCTASRRRWPSSREPVARHRTSAGRQRPRSPAPPAASATAIARALAARGASLILTGRRARGARAAGGGDGRPRARVRPRRPRGRRAPDRGGARRRRAGRQRRAPGQREDPRPSTSRRSTARWTSTCAPRSCSRAGSAERMVARGSGHLVLVSSLAGKVGQRRRRRSTPRRSSACAASATGCARTCAPRGVGVSVVLPGFIRDARHVPRVRRQAAERASAPRPRRTSPRAVVEAIERDKRGGRRRAAGPAGGHRLRGLAPGLSSRVQRRAGGAKVADSMAEGQRSKR